MNPTTQRILLWTGVVGGMIALVALLAYLGTRGTSVGEGTATLPMAPRETDWSKGDPNAKATLVEYSDFQCPSCASIYPIVKQLASDFPNDLRVIYRHFPIREIHPNAQLAAQAAEAAGKQGKFWDMHDVLFNTQNSWAAKDNPEELFKNYARSLGLDEVQFAQDLTSKDTEEKINQEYASAIRAKIQATPTFFLNGKQIAIPNTYEEFKQMIQSVISNQ
ncbi:MAG: thioredoxin domain-containing protein [Patescibacteria group bacterium]